MRKSLANYAEKVNIFTLELRNQKVYRQQLCISLESTNIIASNAALCPSSAEAYITSQLVKLDHLWSHRIRVFLRVCIMANIYMQGYLIFAYINVILSSC